MVELKIEDNHLCIYFEDKLKHRIAVGDNIGFVYVGKNDYKMFHGSFKIKEKQGTMTKLFVEEINKTDLGYSLKLNIGELKVLASNDIMKFEPIGFEAYNRMIFNIPSDKNEGIYGLGENFTEFNFKGKKLRVWVAEHINVLQTVKKLLKQVVGIKNSKRKQNLKNYETYYAQPTYISSKKYFFHSLTNARSEFDFRKKFITRIKIDDIEPFYIGFANDYEELLNKLTSLVGKQVELPDWVYDGQILGIQGGTDIMLEKYHKVKERNGEVCGLWIQDWEGRRVTAVGKQLFWNWEWDKELYPDLDKKIKELDQEGVKVLGYCNPFLAVEKPLYKYASEKGYCVKDKDGKDYYVKITTFPAAMVDLTNKEAYEWLKDIIKKNMVDLGLAGWMADFGEYLPADAVLASGEDAECVHNRWPAIWAKLNREVLEETGNLGKIMFFTRAGYSETPKYSVMMWNGDNHPDFSIDYGLPSIVPATLSLTCSGFGLSHSDIGGYTTIYNLRRDREVYKRWYEMNAFSLILRGHEGLNPDLNIQFDADEDMLEFASKMGRIHKCLKPYLKECVKYNADKGVGVIRPLFFYYDEKEAFNNGYEYLLGRDILVAPVLRPKQTKMEVYLPDDEWIHIWSKKEYKGGKYIIDCPLGQTPVFVRKNAQMDVLKLLSKEI